MADVECVRCKETKDQELCFGKDATRKSGYHPYCNDCRRIIGTKARRNSRRENEDVRRRDNEACKRCYKKHINQRKKYFKGRTSYYKKNSFIKSVYGITLEDYDKMLAEQNGVCAICGKKETRKNKYTGVCRLHIDHDHENGKVRGLLCSKCNMSLGGFNDDIEILNNAIDYLLKNN